ncbi:MULTISPECIES: trypsin-like serine peptidase [Amycolatopsis]|uniref:Trypsin-like serine peptidase n=1 Tax=Amycolatopsis albidoflavus TaxID=102226 RepID=A0ABW5IFT7_9PSEU
MRHAEPADQNEHQQTPVDPAPAIEPSIDVAAPLSPNEHSSEIRNIYITRTAGKVFFHNPGDGKDYVCSGSIVNSPAKNMVVTAGHCAYEDKKWMEKFTFVPGYHNGDSPYGRFVSYNLGTLKGWSDGNSWGYDTAIAVVGKNSEGRTLVDAVGNFANGLQVGGPYERDVTIIGYPADKDGGREQYNCQGKTAKASVFFPNQVTIGCALGGGSSGGPWLVDYQDKPDGTGVGLVHGDTSNGDIFHNLRSPYFTDAGQGNLYRKLANG